MPYRKQLRILHFSVLGLCLANWTMEVFTIYGLQPISEAITELMVILSGLVLMFYRKRPFSQLKSYYSIYPLWLLLIGIGALFKESIGALLLYLLLFPIWPDHLEVQKDQLQIYNNARGFLSRCCPYRITETKALFFEKEIGQFELEEPFNPRHFEYREENQRLVLVFRNRQGEIQEIEL